MQIVKPKWRLKKFFLTWFLPLLLILCGTLNSSYIAKAGEVLPTGSTAQISPPVTSLSPKQQLARDVLIATGIAKQYDTYFDHSIGLVVFSQNLQFTNWLREMLAREAGWKYVEADYIARLEADFSETELKELLSLSQQPLLQKLWRSQFQVYGDTSPARYQRLNQVWDDYNSGMIDPPPPSIFPPNPPRNPSSPSINVPDEKPIEPLLPPSVSPNYQY
jgi:hypothetical protein